eukprot:1148784-Pyramimonas_sp.AAC.1
MATRVLGWDCWGWDFISVSSSLLSCCSWAACWRSSSSFGTWSSALAVLMCARSCWYFFASA